LKKKRKGKEMNESRHKHIKENMKLEKKQNETSIRNQKKGPPRERFLATNRFESGGCEKVEIITGTRGVFL